MRKWKKQIAIALVVIMVLPMLLNVPTVMASSNGIDVALKWVENQTSGTVTGNSLEVTASSTSAMKFTYQVNISNRQSISYAPGTFELRLPRYLYKYRDHSEYGKGENVEFSDIGLYSTESGAEPKDTVPFTYSVEGEYIVVTNTKTVKAALNAFFQVAYKGQPVLTEDGTEGIITTQYSVNGISDTANSLDFIINTAVSTPSVTKTATGLMTDWNEVFDEPEPVDWADYYYYWYRIVGQAAGSQPASYCFEDLAANYGGELLGYYDDYQNNLQLLSDTATYEPGYQMKQSGSGNWSHERLTIYALVRYDKNNVKSNNLKMENEVKMTVKGIDHGEAHKNSAVDVTLTNNEKDPKLPFPGNRFEITKKVSTLRDSVPNLIKTLLDEGMDTTMAKFEVKATGYGYIDEEQYHFTLSDDIVELDAGDNQGYQRLGDYDYYFSTMDVNWVGTANLSDGNSVQLPATAKLYVRYAGETSWVLYKDNLPMTKTTLVDLSNDRGIVQAKAVYEESNYTTTATLTPTVVLRAGSSAAERIRQSSSDDIKIRNIAAVLAENKKGGIDFAKASEADYRALFPDEDDAYIEALMNADLENYGKLVQRAAAEEEISINNYNPAVSAISSLTVNRTGINSDDLYLKVRGEMAERTQVSTESVEYIKEQGVLPEHRKMTWHLLLLEGMELERIDGVRPYNGINLTTGIAEVDVQINDVKLQEDYRGSGRTLLSVELEAVGTAQNYTTRMSTSSTSYLYTGFDIEITTIMSGNSAYYLNNKADRDEKYLYDAWQVEDGWNDNVNSSFLDADVGEHWWAPIDPPYEKGTYYDEASQTADINLFYNLAQKSNVDTTLIDTCYNIASAENDLSYAKSAGSYLEKRAKNEYMDGYTMSNEEWVPAELGGNYSYQLQLSNIDKLENIVFYDFLESATVDNPEGLRWMGDITGIDFSQLRSDYDLSKVRIQTLSHSDSKNDPEDASENTRQLIGFVLDDPDFQDETKWPQMFDTTNQTIQDALTAEGFVLDEYDITDFNNLNDTELADIVGIAIYLDGYVLEPYETLNLEIEMRAPQAHFEQNKLHLAYNKGIWEADGWSTAVCEEAIVKLVEIDDEDLYVKVYYQYIVNNEHPVPDGVTKPTTDLIPKGSFYVAKAQDMTGAGNNRFDGWKRSNDIGTEDYFTAKIIESDTVIYGYWMRESEINYEWVGDLEPTDVEAPESEMVYQGRRNTSTYTEKALAVQAESSEGMTFNGWYDNDGLTGNKIKSKNFSWSASYQPTYTFYGEWKKNITVDYEWVDNGKAPADVTWPDSDTIGWKRPYVSKPQEESSDSDYEFWGWYIDEDCTEKYVDGTELKEDTTLWGKWDIPAIYVDYEWVGDEVPTTVQPPEGDKIEKYSYYSSTPQEIPLTEPDEYTFVGWYWDEELEDKYIDESTMLLDDTTLFGKWLKSSSSDLKFRKVDSTSSAYLEGAVFTLYYCDSNLILHDHDSIANSDDASNCWKVFDVQTSNSDGVVTFAGIPTETEYRLVETTPADRYELVDGQWKVLSDAQDGFQITKIGNASDVEDVQGTDNEADYWIKNTFIGGTDEDLIIRKVDADNDGLTGARFQLYTCTVNHTHDDNYEAAAGNCWYEGTLLANVSSGSDGLVNLGLLSTGEYQLVETAAPTGFNVPDGQWRITVEAHGDINFASTGNAVAITAAPSADQDADYYLYNYPKPEKSVSDSSEAGKNGDRVVTDDKITYEITWSNYTKNTADITITDVLDVGVDFVSALDAQGNKLDESDVYNDSDRTVTWNLTNISAGEGGKVTLTVQVNENAGIKVENQAGVKVGSNPKQDTNPVENPVGPNDPRKPEKSYADESVIGKDDKVKAGDKITYEISYYNHERSAAKVVITDKLDNGVNFVSAKDEKGAGLNKAEVYNDTERTVTWTIDNVAVNTGGKVSLTVEVNRDAVTKVDNTAKVKIGENNNVDTNTLTNPVDDGSGTTDPKKADLEITKESNPASGTTVTNGQEIMYQITVEGKGNDTSKNVIITDTIPAHTTYVDGSASSTAERTGDKLTWKLGDIEPGDKKTVSFKVKVTDLPAGETRTISNTAQAKADNVQEKTSNEVKHTQDGPVTGGPSMVVSKNSDTSTTQPLSGGETITYSISLMNNGDETAKGVVVTDGIPEHTTYVQNSAGSSNGITGNYDSDSKIVTWVLGDVEPGVTVTVYFEVTVGNMEETGTRYIKNKAVYSYEGENPKDTNEITHEQKKEPPAKPDLSITKESDPVSGTKVGNNQKIKYTITVKNDGNGDAKNVIVTDSIPQYTTYVANSAFPAITPDSNDLLTWNLGTIEPSESKTVSFEVTVDEMLESGTRDIKNVAYVKADGVAETPSKTVEHTQEGIKPGTSYLVARKSADPASGTNVKAGDKITYKIDLENKGDTAAAEVWIEDSIPEYTIYIEGTAAADNDKVQIKYENGKIRWALAELKAGESVSVTFQVTVSETEEEAVIKNKASFGYADNDPSETNETTHMNKPGGGGTPTPNPNEEEIMLEVLKSSDPKSGSEVKAGDVIRYYIRVKNIGDIQSGMVTIQDVIPAYTSFKDNSIKVSGDTITTDTSKDGEILWAVSNIEPGEEVLVSFAVTVNKMDAVSRTIKNTAVVTSAEGNQESNTTTHKQVQKVDTGGNKTDNSKTDNKAADNGKDSPKTGDALPYAMLFLFAASGAYLVRKRVYSKKAKKSQT